MSVADFPHLNAVLNLTSAVLLIIGFLLIRRGMIRAHATMMIAATVTSAAFLICYLIYHYKFGEKSSGLQPGLLRTVYFCILFPHLILAIVMIPMILTTLWRASRRRWSEHRRIAKPTFFIWLYVSVTGVMIYWMLYHLFPRIRG